METVMPEPLAMCERLLHCLIDDCMVIVSQKMRSLDKAYASHRLRKEGLSFLTKTLPLLSRALEAGLSSGSFNCPTNFRRLKGSALPAFLQGLLSKIFDDGGHLVSQPDVPAIADVRQICSVFYKAEMEFTLQQQEKAAEAFKITDASLANVNLDDPSVQNILEDASELLFRLLRDFDPQDIVPSHGPGVVASGEKPHEKRLFSTKYMEIHRVYPYYRWCYVNSRHLLHCVRGYRDRYQEVAGKNKVLFVPKDSRGPRTIACEPLEYQYLQQGLRRALQHHIEHHPLTRGYVNFADQSINRSLALLGSLPGTGDRYCTIDLKDASDRVSVLLVRRLFYQLPALLDALLALRTPCSVLPSGEIVSLNKYAAMGSALCFPIEALVFWALSAAIGRQLKLYCPVYVYGDDIIVRKELANAIFVLFPRFGLEVNVHKSFTTGSFRESCGGDYFNGHCITPVRIRTLTGSSPARIASLVGTANQLFGRGYYRACDALQQYLKRYRIPFGQEDSAYLCYFSTRMQPPVSLKGARWNSHLQRWERKRRCISGTSYTSPGEGVDQEYGEYLRKHTEGWSPEFLAGSYAKRHRTRFTYRFLDVHT